MSFSARFSDAWAVDASLYAHFQQGCVCSAAADSPPGAPLPAGVARAVARCADLGDPARARREVGARSPWPDEVRAEVWRDRVLFRRLCARLQFNAHKLKDYETCITYTPARRDDDKPTIAWTKSMIASGCARMRPASFSRA